MSSFELREFVAAILDFGLAKAMAPEEPVSGEAALSESPTLTLAATRRGEILGTAAYMSPEQAKGKAVDRRTDVWAFGACLYEALSGKRAFKGEDASELLGSVLMVEPEWDALPDDTPRLIGRLMRRCLEKDSRNRLHDIADVRIELEASETEESGSQRLEGNGRQVRGWQAVALVLAIAVAFLGTMQARDRGQRVEQVPAAVRRWTVQLPASSPLATAHAMPLGVAQRAMALSPDGGRLAYVVQRGPTTAIELRPRSPPPPTGWPFANGGPRTTRSRASRS